MNKLQKARLVIDQIRALEHEHGEPVAINDAPPGVTGQLIKVDPRWKATILRGITSGSVPVASSRAEALYWQMAMRGILRNVVDLWVGERKVLSAQFDDQRLRLIYWKTGKWEQLFGIT